jgi:hypothetical protein
LVKDENGDLFADCRLNRWKSYLSQLLNIQRVSDIRQVEIHTAEPLVPDPIPFEVEIVIAKLEKQKLSGSDQILAKLIQAGGETLQTVIYKLINLFVIWKNCLINGRSLLLYQFTRRAIKLAAVIIKEYHCYQPNTRCSPISFSQVHMLMKLLGITTVGFDITDQLLITIFCIHQILERKWEYNGTVQQLFVDFKKVYDSVRKKAFTIISWNLGFP